MAASRLGCGLGISVEPRKENIPDMKFRGLECLDDGSVGGGRVLTGRQGGGGAGGERRRLGGV